MRRLRIGLLCLLLLLVVGSSGCGQSSSSEAQGPPGGYDAQGAPLDESGKVSSNPDDYRELVCSQPWAKDAPDYEAQCEDQ